MNYFYIDNDNYIVGFSTTEIENLIKTVPLDCPIYKYQAGDNLDIIVATQEPIGIGIGRRIDY